MTPRTARAAERLSRVDVLALGIASMYVPLLMRAENLSGLPRWHLVLGAGTALWLVALGLAKLAIWMGGRRQIVVGLTFTSLVLITQVGPAYVFSPLGAVAVSIGVVAVARLVLLRLSRFGKAHWIVWGGSLVLMASLVLSLGATIWEWGTDNTFLAEGRSFVASDAQDVYLIVFDGYVGLEGWTGSLPGEPGWHGALAELGFETPESAWASYPWTQTSLPSLLMMDYPIREGAVVNGATRESLYDIISGANPTVQTFNESGYETVMIESPWHGSGCSDAFDVCVGAGFRSEEVYTAVSQSVLRWPVFEQTGHAYATGSIRTMSWLLESSAKFKGDGVPQFVFAHVMIPHPPFFVDARCEVRYDQALSEFSFSRSGVPFDTRAEGFVEQASCADSFMVGLAEQVNPNDVVIYVGDHGLDARGQFERTEESWSIDDLRERMNVLLAVHAPRCQVGSPVVLPNLLRRVISCLSGEPVQDLPPRMFVHQISGLVKELDSSTLTELINTSR